MILVAAVGSVAWGCDDGDDRAIPHRHAVVRGQFQANVTIATAQEWVLLHPNSERQRQARRTRLMLEGLAEPHNRVPVDEPAGDDPIGDLLRRWTDPELLSETNNETVPTERFR